MVNRFPARVIVKAEIEWLLVVRHVGSRSLQHREGCVTFVQVADLRLQAYGSQESPASYSKDELLLQPQVRTAAVQLTGDGAMRRDIRGIVGVQEIQLHSADLHLPGANPEFGAGEIDGEAKPFTVGLAQGTDRQLPGVVEWIESLLPSLRVDFLPKITLLVEQTHADHRDAQIARCLELIAGDVSEATRVNRQRFAQHELHREVCDRLQGRIRMRPLKPRVRLLRCPSSLDCARPRAPGNPAQP